MYYRDEATGNYIPTSIKALDGMPIGSIIQFAGEDIPNGWLVCNGDAVEINDYLDLYNVIGTTYGGGGTNFRLPDFRGRVPVGLDPTDQLETFDTLGNSGGSRYLQAHNHGGSTSTNEAYNTSKAYSTGGNNNLVAINWGGAYIGDDASYRSRTLHSHTIATDGTGDSGNLQPYLVVNFIIKAKNTTPTMASIVNATNNSTEDAYSCKYINDSEKYSTNETKTNKTWVDGKPIYRLVIEITNTNSTTNWRQYDYSTLGIPSGIEMARFPEAYSMIIQENNPYVESFYSQGTRIQTSPATAKVNILGNGTAYNRYIIIMEYTKTTD